MLGLQLADVVFGDMRWVLISNYMIVRPTAWSQTLASNH